MARFLTSKVFSEIQDETNGWKYGYPEMSVIREKRPHSRPPSGSVSSAISSGMIQNSPKMQWKARSLK